MGHFVEENLETVRHYMKLASQASECEKEDVNLLPERKSARAIRREVGECI
jgi:hypothetical protein